MSQNRKKHLNNKGESFIETLVSLMILTIVMVGLTNIVTTVAKVNNSIKNSRVAFDDSEREDVTGTGTTKEWTIEISDSSGSLGTYSDFIMYQDPGSELYYYEAK